MAGTSRIGQTTSEQQRRTGQGETGTEGVLGAATEKAQELAQSATEMAGQARERVQEWTSGAYGYAEDALDSFTSLVRRNPIPSLFIACGIGLLLGMAFQGSYRSSYYRYGDMQPQR